MDAVMYETAKREKFFDIRFWSTLIPDFLDKEI
jgi:hypothetical protein